jgi:hypothetical protein
MADLSLSAVALPAVAAGLADVIPASQSSVSVNGGVFKTSTGSGGSDVVSNANILAALNDSGLLYALMNTTFTDISGGLTAVEQVRNAFMALGGHLDLVGLGIAANASAIAFACSSGAKPTLAITTSSAAAAYFRLALTPSIAA